MHHARLKKFFLLCGLFFFFALPVSFYFRLLRAIELRSRRICEGRFRFISTRPFRPACHGAIESHLFCGAEHWVILYKLFVKHRTLACVKDRAYTSCRFMTAMPPSERDKCALAIAASGRTLH